MDGHSPQYCLFTDDTFRGQHGVSILTTAEIAAEMAEILDDSNVPSTLRESSVGFGNAEAPPYKVMDLPGRGKGAIATRRIKALETIMVDYPALLTINDIEGASYYEIMSMLDMAVDQLPSRERNNVYALARSHGEASAVQDIIRTNSFGLELGGFKHMVVFPRSSVS
jgi:hypothetical protein